MRTSAWSLPVSIFSTVPQSTDIKPELYARTVSDVAHWSDDAGCMGILIYTDNRLVDPWLVAQIVIQSTRALCPLVAIQPAYMHPYSVAKMASSLAHLYGRRVYLNMVAGGFRGDLSALCDETPHDLRYERLWEYTTIVKELLLGKAAISFSGKFYRVENLLLQPRLPSHLFPGIFISGSSEAGMATARVLGATAIEYPNPAEEYTLATSVVRTDAGIRIGLIADENEDKAWSTAYERFPADPKGQILHKLAMRVSDSVWHRQLAELEQHAREQRNPYWLWPFKNYKTFCPYLVGSYSQVTEVVTKYIKAGFTNFILDSPAAESDIHNASRVFREAVKKAGMT